MGDYHSRFEFNEFNNIMNMTNLFMYLNTVFNIIFEYWDKLMIHCDRKRIILDRQSKEPYLERYYLFLKDRKSFPFNIFIHKFLKSDPDDLHDHPWGYFTFIIRGGYWEYLEEDGELVKKWCGPGFYQKVDASHKHRIELDNSKPTCWTLFIPFKRERSWGFYTNDGWVDADKYIASKLE
jgi:hypothetical protein